MQTFKLFLSPQVSVPDDVLNAAGQQLKGYFDRICMSMSPRKFLHSSFKVSPHAGEVGDKDLLVYITQASLILSLLDKVYEPDATHLYPPGHAGGGTKQMPDGRVLSEVFWTGELIALKTSTHDRRAAALANLIFHEWVHNKHTSDPVALSKGGPTEYVHFYCGNGILGGSIPVALAANGSPNQTNIISMARVLDASNPQSLAGLYSDDLGF
jgi:hypothetical protein